MATYTLYRIVRNRRGRWHVGITRNPERREQEHKRRFGAGAYMMKEGYRPLSAGRPTVGARAAQKGPVQRDRDEPAPPRPRRRLTTPTWANTLSLFDHREVLGLVDCGPPAHNSTEAGSRPRRIAGRTLISDSRRMGSRTLVARSHANAGMGSFHAAAKNAPTVRRWRPRRGHDPRSRKRSRERAVGWTISLGQPTWPS